MSIFLGSSTVSVSATPSGDRPPLGHTVQEGVYDGRVGGGTFEFDPHTQILRWKLSSLLSTERNPTLTGSFSSSALVTKPADSRTSRPTLDPSFSLHFGVSNYTFSGLRVDQLKVAGDVGYKPFKGVRTGAGAGRVDVRW